MLDLSTLALDDDAVAYRALIHLSSAFCQRHATPATAACTACTAERGEGLAGSFVQEKAERRRRDDLAASEFAEYFDVSAVDPGLQQYVPVRVPHVANPPVAAPGAASAAPALDVSFPLHSEAVAQHGLDPADLQRIAALPKVELHAHLNGSLRLSTIRELAETGAGDLAPTDAGRLTSMAGRTLAEVFSLFRLIHRVTTDVAVLPRLVREVVEDLAADNVAYAELRTTPKADAGRGLTKRTYMDAVLRGHAAFLARCGLGEQAPSGSGDPQHGARVAGPRLDRGHITGVPWVRWVLSVDRRESLEGAMETVELAAQLKRESGLVVGVDLCGDPRVGRFAALEPAFRRARELGLGVTLHCAEVDDAAEALAMIRFRPDRLGHAVHARGDVAAELHASGIPVEVCPTSNVVTESVSGYSDLHLRGLMDAGHPVCICTDDSGVFGTTLSLELALAARYVGLDLRQLARMQEHAATMAMDKDPRVAQRIKEMVADWRMAFQI